MYIRVYRLTFCSVVHCSCRSMHSTRTSSVTPTAMRIKSRSSDSLSLTLPSLYLMSERTPFLPQSGRSDLSRPVAYLICLICCSCAGSIALFSIYSFPFQHVLGFSQVNINAISISAEIGMYLLAPLFGYYADKGGPSKLTWMSSLLFCPAYLVTAYLYNIKASYHGFAVCFALIGAATTALYLCTVLPCARLYSKSAGLAISLPVTGFGVSSLWQSQVIDRWFYDSDHVLDVSKVFTWYAGLYFATGCLAYSSSLLYNVDDVKEKSEDPEDEDEDESQSQSQRFKVFITNYETWVMLLSFIFTSGALEMYLNNMGAIIDTIPDSDQSVSSHVSMFAILSTVARLTIGVSSDVLRPYISTAIVLSGVLFVAASHHFSIALGLYTKDNGALFSLASGINGLCYGSIFTLYPTVIACVWGLKSFGTNWMMFVSGPAIGSIAYGLLFASVYDRYRIPGEKACIGSKCYELTFLVTGAGILISSIAVFNLWHHVWKKNSIKL